MHSPYFQRFIDNNASSHLGVVEKLLAGGDVLSGGAQSIYMCLGCCPVGAPWLCVKHVAYSLHLLCNAYKSSPHQIQKKVLRESSLCIDSQFITSQWYREQEPQLTLCHQL